MSFKKNLLFCTLAVMLMCILGTVSASDDSSNITLSSDIEDIVANNELDELNENAVSSNNEDSIYVDSNNNRENQDGSEDNPYSNLNEAMLQVPDGGTIHIKNGNYSIERMEINKGMSIIGESKEGVNILSNYLSISNNLLTFNLNGNSLVLQDISFKSTYDYKHTNRAPLVINGNGNFYMDNCLWSFVGVEYDIGVGINNSHISNSVLRSSVRYYGAGNHFINNLSTSGGIYVNNDSAFVNVSDSTFLETSYLFGSGTPLEYENEFIENYGNLNIKKSKFQYLESASNLQSIILNHGNLSINSCIIDDCQCHNFIDDKSGNGITFNYNVFNSCDFDSGFFRFAENTGNLDYNWWEYNNHPYNVSKWVNLEAYLEKNNKIAVVSSLKYSDGENFTDVDNDVFDNVKIKIKSSELTLDTNVVPKNGISIVEFKPVFDSFVSINDIIILPIGDIYVDSTFEGEELGTIDNPFSTISAAVNNAVPFDTIHIKNGIYNEESIVITKSLNFLGESNNGVIILNTDNKGIFSTPTFMSENIDISFVNLTIVNVSCNGMNTAFNIGGIVNCLKISNCLFDNCSGYFGSLSIASSKAALDNCKILNSKTTSPEVGVGAVYFSGDGNYEIKNTYIDNTINSAEYMYGVIYADNNNAILNLYNATILNTNGAAISIINSKGNVTVKHSKILNSSLKSDEFETCIFNIGDNSNLVVTETVIYDAEGLSYLILNGIESNVTFNYNVIDNLILNIIKNNFNYNFDYNWWGTNEKPNNLTDKWVLLQFSSFDIKYGLLSVNLEFKHYINDGKIYDIGRIPIDEYRYRVDKVDFPNSGIEFILKTSPNNISYTIYSEEGNVIGICPIENVESIEIASRNTTLLVLDNVIKSKIVYVDSNNENNGNGTLNNPYNNLMEAINNVDLSSTIFVKNGSYIIKRQSFNIKSDMSIIGESNGGVIIINDYPLGQDSFNLENVICSMTNLTFSKNKFNFAGEGEFNFNNCSFTGGISVIISVDNVVMNNSSFDDNFALDISNGATVEFDNVNITNYGKTFTSQNYPIHSKGNFIIKNSIFKDNAITRKATMITKENSLIYLEGGDILIDNCTFINSVQFSAIVYNSQTNGNIIIKNSRIENNSFVQARRGHDTAIAYGGDNCSIESNVIANNTGLNYLIYNSDSSSTYNVNYNLIYNNVYAKDVVYSNGVNNLDYNWWGSNTPTYADANTWIIIDASYAPKDIVAGDNVTVTATLNHYITKDGEIGELTKSVLDDAEVTFTLADGTVVSKTTENIVAEITYTINQSENVTISAYGEQVTVPIALKTLRINIDEVRIDGNTNITILSPGVKANVTLIIDGVSKTVEVNDSYTETLENLKAGNHSVVVIYNDGTTFDYDSKTFTVEKLPTKINLDNITVDAGESAPIEFTIAEDATGKVFVEVNGVKSFNKLVDGTFAIDLDDLTIGNNTVYVSYEGDAKYLPSSKSILITVNALDAGLKANTSDIKVGEDAIVNVEINSDVAGSVVVILGKEYPVVFVDGKASVIIPDLAKGTYTVTVKFVGDNKYLADEVNLTLTVSKVDLPEEINITTDIPEGTTAPEFSINLPEDATGNFTVYVDGIPYVQELVNGSATVKVPEQTPGNHTISTEYSGDAKYPGFKSDNSTMNVPKANVPGGENALNMTTPSNSATPTYSISLPKDAKGNLTVTVDGKDTYTKALENGSATVSVPELASGKHDITVTYTGDDKYASISKTTSVNVPAKSTPAKPVVKKQATKITAKKKTFKASKKVKKYTITLKAGKKPVKKVTVTIKVGKKTYKAKTNAKGKATFKLKKLTKKGKYKAVIKFKGNKNYKASSKKVRITVKK